MFAPSMGWMKVIIGSLKDGRVRRQKQICPPPTQISTKDYYKAGTDSWWVAPSMSGALCYFHPSLLTDPMNNARTIPRVDSCKVYKA